MKNFLQNVTQLPVVNASDSTDTNKRFSFKNITYKGTSSMIAKNLFACLFMMCLFLSVSMAASTLSCVVTQNGTTAIITCTLCPWNESTDNDFSAPTSSDKDVVAIQSYSKSTVTVNGGTCRQMVVQVKKKKAGNATIEIYQSGGPSQSIPFDLTDELFCMFIPNHVNYENFITNGFHPGEVANCMLKIIDTETGNDNLSAHGTAKVSIIGTGFTFNNNLLNKTINFVNGIASVPLYANQPNSGYCYFQIKDDTLPTSVGGSDVLHIAKISLTPAPMSIQFATNNVACGTTNTGSAMAMVTGGTSPYLYYFNNGPATNNMNISGLTAGVYNVMVTDFYGNTKSSIFGIASPPVLNISASVEQPFCSPNGLGSIHVSVDGASSPINYLWNDGSNLDTRTNLSPGNYFVQAVDANGCSTAKTFNLTSVNSGPVVITPSDIITNTEPGKDFAFVKYHLDVIESCIGYVDISVNHASGTAFYKGVTNVSYKAVDGSGLSTSGSFNVIVNDDEAPVANAKDLTVNLNSNGIAVLTPEMLDDSSSDNCGIISKSVTPNTLSCSSIGSHAATLTVTDGNNYYWVIDSNGVKYYNNTGVLINTYTSEGLSSVIVTKDGGFIIIDPKAGIIRKFDANGVLQSTIFTSADEKVKVILTPDGGFIVQDPTAGTIRKFDANGVLQSTIFTSADEKVKIILLPDGGFIVQDPTAGTVRLFDANGVLQSTIFTSADEKVKIILLPGGKFIVQDPTAGTIRLFDANGVLQSTIFTSADEKVKIILLPGGKFIVQDPTAGTIRLFDANGVLQSTIFTSADEKVKIILLPGGKFIVQDPTAGTIRLFDANGVLQSTIFTSADEKVKIILLAGGKFIVQDPTAGTIRLFDANGVLQSTIFTSADEKVKIILLPGGKFIVQDPTAGTIRLFDANGVLQSTIFTSADEKVKIILLPGGKFIVQDPTAGTVRLFDANGVLQSTIFTSADEKVKIILTPDGGFIVQDPTAGTIRKFNANGELQSTIFTSADEKVKIILLPGGGFIVQDPTAGTIRLYDANGVLQSTIFTSADEKVKVILLPGGKFIVQDPTAGTIRLFDANGVLQSTIFTSTDEKAKVILTPDGGFIVQDPTAGTIRKYDANGVLQSTIFTSVESVYYINKSLSSSATAMVTVPNPITVTGVVKNIDCSGVKSGKVTLTVSGITGPYTYAWSNSKTTKNLTALAAGTYAVVITDKNGCNNGASFIVSQPTAMAITMTKTAVKCGGAKTGKATATVTGGTAPYLYAWSTSPVKTTAAVTGLAAGTYTLTVTDANGCSKTKSVVVPQTNAPIALAQQATTYSATVTASGGVAPYTYLWSNGQTTNTATGLTCGNTYTCTVTDSKGCKATIKIKIICPRFGETVSDNNIVVSAFPNPTSGTLSVTVQNQNDTKCLTELFDIAGRLVYSSTSEIDTGEPLQIDMSSLSDGVYSLRITTGNQVKSQKVILQKNK